MTVAGRWPARNACICATSSAALRPASRGTAVSTPALAGWQPEHEVAPGGASADAAGQIGVAAKPSAAATRRRVVRISRSLAKASGGLSAAAPGCHANWRLLSLSGNDRMRLPVALKYALSTAGGGHPHVRLAAT